MNKKLGFRINKVCPPCKYIHCPFALVCKTWVIPKNLNHLSPLLVKAYTYTFSHHSDYSLKLKDVAKESGCTPRRLQQLFHDELHCTFKKCLFCLRASHAQILYRDNPSLTVKEIYMEVGFHRRDSYDKAQKQLRQRLKSIHISIH